MKPILFPADETQFVSNGLGRLSDAISCKVTEERNGQYELELQYPVTGKHYDAICEERIIAARHDDTGDIQPFRIYKITRPMNGKVTVNARHISYQLSKVVVMPFTAQSCVAALQGMNSHSLGDNPFTMWTDKSLSAPFKIEVPSSFRSMLGGVQGSILDVYGPGEFEWDKYTVKFYSRRGQDTNVTIRYGKNLTDLKKTTDMSNVWTGVVPYWAGTDDANNPIVVTLSAPVYASTVSDYAYKLLVPVDFSGSFEEKPAEAQLRQKAEQYVQNNADSSIPASIDISFVALWQTEEYKNVAPLQRLQLCDTVTVHHRGLGIDTTAKIVSVTYDVLLERYEKMTLGEVKTSLGDAIREMATEAVRDVPTTSAMQQAIQKATNLITGGLGGHVVLTMNANGQPEEILILDTDSIDTAVEVLRINRNGIGFSSHGYEGPFESAWTLDGHFVADFITTGNLNAALITTGVIQDAQGYNFWDMDTGEFQLASTTKVGNQTLASYITDRMTKQEIFNKLTDNGATQGIYMQNGRLYLNGTYMKTGDLDADLITTGKIQDAQGYNFWDLDTGEFQLASSTKVGNQTLASYISDNVSGGLSKEAIFNTLTDNGRTQGIYMNNGLLYLNATYMNTGSLSAALITSGKIQSRNGKVYFDLDNNELHCDTLVCTSTDSWAKTLKAQIGDYTIQSGNGYFHKKGLLVSAGDSTATGIFLVPGGESSNSYGDCPQVSASDRGLSVNTRPASNGYSSGMGGITFTPNGDVAIAGYVDTSALTPSWIESHDDISSGYSNTICGMIIIRPSMKRYSSPPSGSYVNTGNGYYQTDGTIILKTPECYCQGSFRGNSARFRNIYGIDGSSGTGVTILADYVQTEDLYCSGGKTRVVDTKDYGKRLLYCYEMPSPIFGDLGEGQTDDTGECVILLDDVFSETIRADLQYQVFLQKEGEGDLWVEKKTPSFFVVRGTPNLPFAWELKAKQRDFEIKRLESRFSGYEEEAELETPESLYEDELWALIREQEELLYETA